MNQPSTIIIDDPTAAFLAECCALRGSQPKFPGLYHPFRAGDWIYATDGRIAARLSIDLAPSALVTSIGPPAGAIPPRSVADLEFTLNAFDRRRSAVSVPECGPWLVACQYCNGSGQVPETAEPTPLLDCDDCNGTGKVMNWERVTLAEAPGRPPYQFSAFIADRLRRADAAVYLPEDWPADRRDASGPDRTRFAAAFVCPDGCEGLAMPMVPER